MITESSEAEYKKGDWTRTVTTTNEYSEDGENENTVTQDDFEPQTITEYGGEQKPYTTYTNMAEAYDSEDEEEYSENVTKTIVTTTYTTEIVEEMEESDETETEESLSEEEPTMTKSE